MMQICRTISFEMAQKIVCEFQHDVFRVDVSEFIILSGTTKKPFMSIVSGGESIADMTFNGVSRGKGRLDLLNGRTVVVRFTVEE